MNSKNWFKCLLLPHAKKWLAQKICHMNSLISWKFLLTLWSKQLIFPSHQGWSSNRKCHNDPSFWNSFLGFASSSHKSEKAKPEMIRGCNSALSSAALENPFGVQNVCQARCVFCSSSGSLITENHNITRDLDVSREYLRS